MPREPRGQDIRETQALREQRETREASHGRDIIAAFRHTQAQLARAVDALEERQNDLEGERRTQHEAQVALQEVIAQRHRTAVALEEAERDCKRLRDDLNRMKTDAGRATQESQTRILHLESIIAKERAEVGQLQDQVAVLTQRCTNIEQNADRRVFQLTQDLDQARQEIARVKGEKAELRSQLDEAEFAHRALKEGGARLARELAEREKKMEDMGKGRRWGMI